MPPIRVRSLPWHDLVPLRRWERARELLLPLPWLVLALWAASRSLWVIAPLASFYFYLAGLRLVHDTFHGNLGLPRRANDAVLATLSLLMLGSMHAVRLTHLQHHRDCLGDDDVEGATARGSAAAAILQGAAFPVRLHRAALHLAGPRQRRWIHGELAIGLVFLGLAIVSGSTVLRYHLAAMIAAQSLSGFFAVWTVHHDCDRWNEIARTLRHRLKSAVVLDMFYHLEHHLYPRIPTCRLPVLAERLDRELPELVRKQVY